MSQESYKCIVASTGSFIATIDHDQESKLFGSDNELISMNVFNGSRKIQVRKKDLHAIPIEDAKVYLQTDSIWAPPQWKEIAELICNGETHFRTTISHTFWDGERSPRFT